MKLEQIAIPKEPVDRFEIKWFNLSVSFDWCHIAERRAVYYTNSPYSVIRPDDPGYGAPLENQWMLYDESGPIGRLDTWDRLQTFLLSPDFHATREEAKQDAIHKLNGWIESCKQRVQGMEKLKDELV